jgi:hypothetical protein
VFSAVEICYQCRSSHGLRRNFVAARLLVLRVRIPPVAWMFMLSVVSKDIMGKCRTVRTKTQARMKYKQSRRDEGSAVAKTSTW